MERPIHLTVISCLYGLIGFAATTLLTRHDVVALLGILLGILAIVAAAGMLRGKLSWCRNCRQVDRIRPLA